MILSSFRKDSIFSIIFNLTNATIDVVKGMLYSEDGNILLIINETIYTIESSQGEPYYYIGRIVKFEVLDEYSNLIKSLMEITTFFPAKNFNLRMNWF